MDLFKRKKKVEELELIANQAYSHDFGEGIARIDFDSMDSLDLKEGEVVEIKHSEKAVAKVLPLNPSDEGKKIIRMDGLIRDSTGGDYGKPVKIKKTESVKAKVITLRATDDTEIGSMNTIGVADNLEGIPLRDGNYVRVMDLGTSKIFQVESHSPESDVVVVSEKTRFVLHDSWKRIRQLMNKDNENEEY